MSSLFLTIKSKLAETPMQFSEVVDSHLDVSWRVFLQAWGQLREEDILKRDDIGRYYIEGGAAEEIAAKTKAE